MTDQPCHMHEPDERDRECDSTSPSESGAGFDANAPRGEHRVSRTVEPSQDVVRDRDEIAQ